MTPVSRDRSGEFDLRSEPPFRVDYAATDQVVKPIYLFADSQPLFWQEEKGPFLRSIAARIAKRNPSAAYVGASNGDDPEFYALFEAALDGAGIGDRRMIPSQLSADDLDHLDRADIVLLAGGDVERGWRTFESNGLKQILVRRYYEGALLIGVSAGAIQLGLAGWGSEPGREPRLVDTFRILPHLVGAHEEDRDWQPLKEAVRTMGEHARGYGVPFGGGFIYPPHHSIEPLRKPLVEIRTVH